MEESGSGRSKAALLTESFLAAEAAMIDPFDTWKKKRERRDG